MDQLIDSLELLCIRLKCGHTPLTATRGLNQPEVDHRLNRRWLELRRLIDEGKAPALGATESFLEHVKLVRKLESLLSQKTTLPRLQSRVLTAAALLFATATTFLFPAHLQPSGVWIGCALLFFSAGTVFSELLVRRFRSQLWFSDWLLFLSQISHALRWGQTLPSLLHERPWARSSRDWPPFLKRELEIFARHASAGLEAPPRNKTGLKVGIESVQASEHLNWLKDQWRRGEPMGAVLDSLIPSAVASFERRLTLRADRLSFMMLVPLFLGFLPGFLALLLGPVLDSLSKAVW